MKENKNRGVDAKQKCNEINEGSDTAKFTCIC